MATLEGGSIKIKATNLLPSLIMAVGLIVSTALAVATETAGWVVLGAPLLMALVILGAALLDARLRGMRAGLPVALLLGAVLLVAGAILTANDPAMVPAMMPILGGGAAFAALAGRGVERARCRE